MSKKGMSHIEVVLSFIIFLSAVVLIFYFFNPTQTGKLSGVYLDELFYNFEKNTSNDLLEIGIKINNTNNQIGANGNILSIELNSELNESAKTIVRDLSGTTSASRTDANNKHVFCFDITGMSNFVNARIAKEFNNPKLLSANCPAVNPNFYEIGSVKMQSILSESGLLAINKSYYENYSILKPKLGVSKNRDFDFIVIFNDGFKIEARRAIPDNAEVKATNKRIEIMRKNSNIEFADINFRIW